MNVGQIQGEGQIRNITPWLDPAKPRLPCRGKLYNITGGAPCPGDINSRTVITGRSAYQRPWALRAPTSHPRIRLWDRQMPHSCPGPAMGPRLLLCVALCLLTAGHMDAMVTQSPRYQVTRVGKPVNLSCSQDMNHDAMYWYQQKLNQAPKLLFYYYDQDLYNERGTSDNFQPNQPNSSFSSLGIQAPGLGDSALYLCASSKGTALECHRPSAHKPVSRSNSPL